MILHWRGGGEGCDEVENTLLDVATKALMSFGVLRVVCLL